LSLRDYGLPNPTPVGTPTWKAVGVTCPHCQAALCEVTLKVTMPQLRGGEGICVYLGCPACPYASPSMTRTTAPQEDDGNDPAS